MNDFHTWKNILAHLMHFCWLMTQACRANGFDKYDEQAS